MARLIPKWYKGTPEAIDPDCLRHGDQRKDPHFINDGYFLPCCECDPPIVDRVLKNVVSLTKNYILVI